MSVVEPDRYSSAESVISYTGVQPVSLGAEDEDALKVILNEWLDAIKDFIDRDRGQDFHEDYPDVPAAIDNIAMRIAANIVRQAEQQRSGSVIRVDDMTVRIAEPEVFTSAIRRDLRRFPKPYGKALRMFVSKYKDKDDNGD